MSKIDFIQKRSFGDMITATFNFVKQEFGSLLRYFAIVCLPLVILELVLKTSYLSDYFNNVINPLASTDEYSSMLQIIWNAVAAIILTFWIQLFTLSYVRVYLNKRHQAEGRVTLPEILRVMVNKLGITLVWFVINAIIVSIAFCFLIVPGLYLCIGLMFTSYYIILKDEPLSQMFNSLRLIWGKWWSTFAYILVISIVVNVIAYVFSAPLMVTTAMTVITGDAPGIYETALILLLSSVGQYLLQIVIFVGVSMKFFSLLDEQEHTSVLDKIGQLGTVEEQTVNEGER